MILRLLLGVLVLLGIEKAILAFKKTILIIRFHTAFI